MDEFRLAAVFDVSAMFLCEILGVDEETKPIVSNIRLARRAMRLAPVDNAAENKEGSAPAALPVVGLLSCRLVLDALIVAEC